MRRFIISSVIGLPRVRFVVANPSLARRTINGHRHHPGCYGAVEGAQPGRWLQSSYTTSRDVTLWVGDSYDVRIQRAPDGTLTTDLSGSRAILKLEGAAWREVISALVPIDVHPEIFPNGAAAASVAGYMPVVLWRIAGLEGAEIATYRSFAGSLWHMVERAAEPFGFHVTE